MFYDPRVGNHGLPHNPFNSLVIPRPIAWITTMNTNGSVNLAPFSHFNVCSTSPPTIMFGPGVRTDGHMKDTPANIVREKEFVVNIVTAEMVEQMNISSAELDHLDDEVSLAGLHTTDSQKIQTPSLLESPISLECELVSSMVLEGQLNGMVIFGSVVGVRIEDRVLTGGLIDVEKLRPVARLGYFEYAIVEKSFTLKRPSEDDVNTWRDRPPA